jgi:hypothetical protein
VEAETLHPDQAWTYTVKSKPNTLNVLELSSKRRTGSAPPRGGVSDDQVRKAERRRGVHLWCYYMAVNVTVQGSGTEFDG